MADRVIQLQDKTGTDNLYPIAGGMAANSVTKAMLAEGVFEGETLSTPTDVDYVATDNIQDSAVTNAKLASKAVKSQNIDMTVLYNNASGATGTIPLSDSAANYSFMEIYFKDAVRYGSVKVDDPNGKTALLFTSSIGSNGNYNNYKIVNVSGTSITVAGYNQVAILTSGNTVNSQENILIYKVIGYK